MYKELLMLGVRFQTVKGPLSLEQLFGLDKNDLNVLAVSLEEQYEASKGKSFLRVKTKKDKTLKLMFDVVLDILETKMDKEESDANALEVKKEEQRLLGLIQDKKQSAEKELSIEELEAKLKALRK